MRRALLFDLDETLIVDEQAVVAALEATAGLARERHDIDPSELATATRARARELWRTGPEYVYCLSIGITSSEGLWCRFEGGDQPETRALQEWAPGYRHSAWRLALADQGVIDGSLSEELAERFGLERRARHEVFDDVGAALDELADSATLALITNGASDLQREKLAASELGGKFAAVVVSAEFGIGKPDPTIFEHALAQLGADKRDAVMVGDSVDRDVDGAVAAGLRGVWINRFGERRPDDRPDLVEISTLTELPAALAALA
jgi:putative hydrolase of the HAD superfamily